MESTIVPVGPSRRTRREMQAETRQRLMAAALDLIATGGVAAASIRGICEAAGFSQGAFYSNFATKDDLMIALVGDHMATLTGALDGLVARTREMSLHDSLRVILPQLAALARTPVASLLVVELHLHARRNPAFAARFAPVRDAYQAQFTRITGELIDRYTLRPVVPAKQIAWTMTALWSGSITQAAFSEPVALEELMGRVFLTLMGGGIA